MTTLGHHRNYTTLTDVTYNTAVAGCRKVAPPPTNREKRVSTLGRLTRGFVANAFRAIVWRLLRAITMKKEGAACDEPDSRLAWLNIRFHYRTDCEQSADSNQRLKI